MATPEERRDTRGRVDLFQPNSLTHEEAELLKRLRYEAAFKRGYPLGIVCAGLSFLVTKKFSTTARIALVSLGGIAGNVVGKVSYLPTIHRRLLSDLSESSPLRQRIELLKKEGPAAFAEQFRNLQRQTDHHDDHDVQFDVGSEYDTHNMEPHDGSTVTQQKKFVTYEELRERNRKGSPVTPKSEDFGTFGQILNNTPPGGDSDQLPVRQHGEDIDMSEKEILQPKQNIRYNKYGDPIIE